MLEKHKAEQGNRMQREQTGLIARLYWEDIKRRVTKGIQALPTAALWWHLLKSALPFGMSGRRRKIENPVGFRFLAGEQPELLPPHADYPTKTRTGTQWRGY
jgi:hypothetical protein